MIKRMTIVFCVISFMACTPKVSLSQDEKTNRRPMVKQTINKPKWVLTKPNKEGYYIGLGSASIYLDNYHRIAKDKALEDMLTEIKTTISSESYLHQKDLGTEYSETYESLIKTSNIEELSEYEVLSEWNGENEYWIAYKLSKSRYLEIKKAKKELIRETSLEHLKNALVHEKKGEFIQAISSYSQAVEILGKYHNETFQTDKNGNSVSISILCQNNIQNILNDLTIAEKSIHMNLLSDSNAIITFTCRGIPVNGLTLIYNQRNVVTNQNGQFSLAYKSIANESSLTFFVSKSLANGFSKKIHLPKFDIPVSVQPINIYLNGSEYILGKQKTSKNIKSQLINLLSHYQLVFNEDPKVSNFQLSYKVTTRQGNEFNGLFISWADIQFDLYSSEKELIYSNQLLNIKGIHGSYEIAAEKAIQNIHSLLEEKIINPFIETIY